MSDSVEIDAGATALAKVIGTEVAPVGGWGSLMAAARAVLAAGYRLTGTDAQGQKRLAYVIHEAVCTAYKHEGRNALCERAAIAIYASEWFDAATSATSPAKRAGEGGRR